MVEIIFITQNDFLISYVGSREGIAAGCVL